MLAEGFVVPGNPILCPLSHVHLSPPHSVFLVFEYCEHDLGRLLDAMPAKFSIAEVKCLMKQVRFTAEVSVGGGARPRCSCKLLVFTILITAAGVSRACREAKVRGRHSETVSTSTVRPAVVHVIVGRLAGRDQHGQSKESHMFAKG